MQCRLTGAKVVAIWGGTNLLFAAMLLGFVVSLSDSSLFVADVYGGAVLLVFLVAALAWLARRRHPEWRGLRVPRRPAAALLLALAATLIWLGLPFGMWLPILAAIPLALALLLELSARRS